MDPSFNITSVCRICLNEGNEQINSFSENIESKEILQKISNCFQINLVLEKHLPCVICDKCIEDFNKANEFRIKCLTIEERFKKYCDDLSNKGEHSGTAVENSDSNYDDPNTYLTVNVEESETINQFKCELCNKVLKTKKSLIRHIESMHEKKLRIGQVTGSGTSRRYHCTSCSYSTPHNQTLVNHMRRHSGERPFKCECGKSFTQASGLAAHRKSHSNITHFTCSQCGKQFKHAFSLKTHLQVHCEGQFKCTICNDTLKSKETLHAHIRRHCKVFNFNCEDCGEIFVTSSELINHKKKHTKKTKIKCNFCDYCTDSKKSISIHLKRHVGDKNFNCIYCLKAFVTQSDLKRHTRVHTKEKMYSCDNCTQKFAYSSSLNKHMLVVHGINYKWKDVKSKKSRGQNVTV